MTIVERRSTARLADDRRMNRRFWWIESVIMAVVAVTLIVAGVVELVH